MALRRAPGSVARAINNSTLFMNNFRLPFPFVPRFALRIFVPATIALICLALAPDVRGNVYATNLRLNGAISNVNLGNNGVSITYILNEAATGGVKLQVKAGTNTVRTIALTNGSPGTLRGTNLVVWDGKDDGSNAIPNGSYSISVTASAMGHNEWTQISDDQNAGNYVWDPRGIAINKNTNSPYYGRVFVGNAQAGPNPAGKPGSRVGFQKLNADGSPAAEGIFSTGGWHWAGDEFSPWKIEVSEDDVVYVGDFTAKTVLRFDQTLATNSLRAVLRPDNWPASEVALSGPCVTGSGTNTQIWMTDARTPGIGILRWNLSTNGVVATNDTGSTIVQAGPGSDYHGFSYDVAVDGSNRIYATQYRVAPDDSDFRLLRFPAYHESDNPETTADWQIGSHDDSMGGAHGIAVDPATNYFAVAFQGVFVPPFGPFASSSIRVFSLNDGASVASPTPTLSGPYDFRDVAWDNVGNLYALESANSLWMVFSPPGTNEATTVAVANVTVGSTTHTPPILSEPYYTAGQFHFFLTGEPDVTYVIEESIDLKSWSAAQTSSPLVPPAAKRPVTVNTTNALSFYRAYASGSSPVGQPTLSAPFYSAGHFQFTLSGTANATYIIQATGDARNWSAVATNTSTSAIRLIDVVAPNSQGLYRVQVVQ
jgi:hypothetical protein